MKMKEYNQIANKIEKSYLEWYFVTFVTHNSRISERMVTYNSELFIENLTPYIFNLNKRILITQLIIDQCKKHNIKVCSLNVLPDHVHIVIAGTNKSDIDKKVQLIKGGSSFLFKKEIIEFEVKHIWAQKYHLEYINTVIDLLNIIEYINNNHYKHSSAWGKILITQNEKHIIPLIKKIIVDHESINE